MKERPILFNGEMVRAILEGRKTMTRRIIKPQPTKEDYKLMRNIESSNKKDKDLFFWGKFENYRLVGRDHVHFKCPFGEIGDRLWVRETWLYDTFMEGEESDDIPQKNRVIYRATNPNYPMTVGSWKWKPSIFMPRRASRITLEITNIRVERLNDISEEDAISEGIVGINVPSGGDDYYDYWRNYAIPQNREDLFPWFISKPIQSFKSLWESINGKDSWEQNPFVWVIEFKKV